MKIFMQLSVSQDNQCQSVITDIKFGPEIGHKLTNSV